MTAESPKKVLAEPVGGVIEGASVVHGTRGLIEERVASSSDVVRVGEFSIETLTGPEITPETLNSLTDYYRAVFSAEYAAEGFVCLDCGTRISSHDAVLRQSTTAGHNIPPEVMQGVLEKSLRFIPAKVLDGMTPPACDCGECDSPMVLFHGAKATREKLEEQLLRHNSVLMLMKDGESKLAGFSFGLSATPHKVFEMVWENPLDYAEGHPRDQRWLRSWEGFEAFFLKNGVNLDEEIVFWPALVCDRSGEHLLRRAIGIFLLKLKNHYGPQAHLFGEVEIDSKSCHILTAGLRNIEKQRSDTVLEIPGEEGSSFGLITEELGHAAQLLSSDSFWDGLRVGWKGKK